MDRERFERQLAFILEADREKGVLRQTHLSRGGRRENDAEHCWHMALMCLLLKEYANAEIDVTRTLAMILVHDLVEIDAGDTYAYDTEGMKTQAEREKKAADRLFGILPDDQRDWIRGLFEEFEAYETPEARFAHCMDNFQPLILNHSNEGGDWREHGIHRSQVEKRNALTGTGSGEIWQYMQEILDEHVARGDLKPD